MSNFLGLKNRGYTPLTYFRFYTSKNIHDQEHAIINDVYYKSIKR